MSLLSKPRMIRRWKKTLLVLVSILLLVPCVAAATVFNMRFDLETVVQDPPPQELERQKQPAQTELEKEKREINARMETLKARAERMDAQKERRANDAEAVKELERRKELDVEMMLLKMKAAELEAGQKERISADSTLRAELEQRKEFEMEMKAIRQGALVKLARINMDQAIQIATSQTPGKVMVSSLDAKGWEEPGKLSRDGVVFYHVVIADEVNNGATHVFVNAVDGTIIKTETELPRKRRSPENQ